MIINRFCLVPIIYPRKKTNLDKIISNLNPPLEVFFTQKYKLQKWKHAVDVFKKLIHNWQNFRLIRSRIEDLFNIAKNCLDMKQIHQYTILSVKKKVSRVLFITEKLISICIEENIELKAIPFW